MVAHLMFFSLGFLIASLIALIIFPSFNARATRLAKRRVEALLPISLAEVTAQRDFVRAESALASNRKDRLLERKNEALHLRMVELGKSITENATVNAELTDLRRQLAGDADKLQTANEQINTLAEKLRKAEMDNSTKDQAIASDKHRLMQLETELAKLAEELSAQRVLSQDQEDRLNQKAERIIALQQEALLSHPNDDISRRIEELADSIMADATGKRIAQQIKQTQQADIVQAGRLPLREVDMSSEIPRH